MDRKAYCQRQFKRALKGLFLCLVIALGSMPLQSQEMSTIGEIYDFDVGDVFHYRFWASSPTQGESSITNIEIIGKVYSSGNDTLFYEREIAYHRTYPDPIIEYYTDEVFFINLDSLINMGFIDTVYLNPDLYNGRVINGISYDVWHFDYVEGCGQANAYYNDGFSVFSENELVYFKKGDEEWGTAITVGVDEIRYDSMKTSIYPNPFTTSTTIEYTLDMPSDVLILIYNAQGQVVERLEGKQRTGLQKVVWVPGNQRPGLYYYWIKAGEEIGSGKLVMGNK